MGPSVVTTVLMPERSRVTLAATAGSTRYTAVDDQLANVQPAHFKGIDGQGAHMPTLHRKRANGEPSDGKRADRSGPNGERAEGRRTKAESGVVRVGCPWSLPASRVAG
jgi:hypothetical protein